MKTATLENINRFNIVKNTFQFIVGAILFYVIMGPIEPIKLILSLIGFVLAYESVYHFNDLMDYNEDRTKAIKRATKPFARGEVSREYVESKYFIYLVIGLSISFVASTYFGLIVATMLALNFLHSSSIFKLKKTIFLLPNIFIIEILKFSSGWFAMTSSIEQLPIFIIMALAGGYTFSYVIYKKEGKVEIQKRREIIALIGALIFYMISLIIYPYKLPLLFMIPVVSTFALIQLHDNPLSKFRIGATIGLLAILTFLIFMVFLTTEPFSGINFWLGTWLKV